jgi:hypothetical protein
MFAAAFLSRQLSSRFLIFYLENFMLCLWELLMIILGKTGKLRDLKARLASLNEESQKLKTLTESSRSSKASIPKLSDKVRPLTKPETRLACLSEESQKPWRNSRASIPKLSDKVKPLTRQENPYRILKISRKKSVKQKSQDFCQMFVNSKKKTIPYHSLENL